MLHIVPTPPAATGAALIMEGAVFTHSRRGQHAGFHATVMWFAAPMTALQPNTAVMSRYAV